MPDEFGKKKGLSANWAVREVDQLFGKLTRYTRFVLYSKWSLAVLALLLMAVLIAWPYVTRNDSGVRVSFIGSAGQLVSKTGLAPRMQNPRFEGVTDAGDTFKVTGAMAIQEANNVVVVEKVNGELIRKNGQWLSLSADNATYYQAQNLLDLKGNVNVINDQGYNILTDAARVDTRSMRVVGDGVISGTGPSGALSANGFEMTDNGATVTLGKQGRVKVRIEP